MSHGRNPRPFANVTNAANVDVLNVDDSSAAVDVPAFANVDDTSTAVDVPAFANVDRAFEWWTRNPSGVAVPAYAPPAYVPAADVDPIAAALAVLTAHGIDVRPPMPAVEPAVTAALALVRANGYVPKVTGQASTSIRATVTHRTAHVSAAAQRAIMTASGASSRGEYAALTGHPASVLAHILVDSAAPKGQPGHKDTHSLTITLQRRATLIASLRGIGRNEAADAVSSIDPMAAEYGPAL